MGIVVGKGREMRKEKLDKWWKNKRNGVSSKALSWLAEAFDGGRISTFNVVIGEKVRFAHGHG